MEHSFPAVPFASHSLLAPLGRAYALGMRLRNALFFHGLRHRFRPQAPVVSVGNISMGGSGKTPVSSWLLGRALGKGLMPCLLTRGYRGKPPGLPFRVRPDSPWPQAGDEPLLLARTHPEAAVLVDPVRARAARLAQASIRPDLFILDDGFQHLAMHRDLDLVLMRPHDLGDGWNRVVPHGRWREAASALERAHAFLVKCGPGEFKDLEPLVNKRLAGFERPVFAFSLDPAGFVRVADNAPVQPPEEAPYVLATAVAEPGQVRDTVQARLGRPPVRVMAFADHHPFAPEDARAMAETAGNAGLVVVTAKDAVKLKDLADHRFLALEVAPRFHGRLFSPLGFETWLDTACPAFNTTQQRGA